MGLEAENKKDIFKRIQELKINTPIDDLCAGLEGSEVFQEYLSYCRNLRFEEQPDYQWIKNLFRNLYERNFGLWDNVFNWNYQHVNLLVDSRTLCSNRLLVPAPKSKGTKWGPEDPYFEIKIPILNKMLHFYNNNSPKVSFCCRV